MHGSSLFFLADLEAEENSNQLKKEASQTKKVHIFGASGCGVTALGIGLSKSLNIPVFDSDDYYWKKTLPPFTSKNSIPDRQNLLLYDISNSNDWIISGSLDSWAEPFENQFDVAIFLTAQTEMRIERLKKRELERYGHRILVGGDMEKTHREFIEWAAQYDAGILSGRSLLRHETWIKTLRCPVVRIDGSLSAEAVLNQALCDLRL